MVLNVKVGALVSTLHLEEEEADLLETLCKKAAYTVEILCWQNVRDVIAEEIRPLTDKHIHKLLVATKISPDVDREPKFMHTLTDVVTQYDDLLARMQRSGLTCAMDAFDILPKNKYSCRKKYRYRI